jgi:predicted HTH domain antitoxin
MWRNGRRAALRTLWEQSCGGSSPLIRTNLSAAEGSQQMADILSLDLLEDELNAIMQAGGYRSREDTVVHALEVLLAANPQLRVSTAIELYRKGGVTLSRAVENSGLESESFKDKLVERDVPFRVDEPPEEIRAGAELIGHLRQAP